MTASLIGQAHAEVGATTLCRQALGIGTCPASLAVLLDQPAPALVPAERAGDGPAARQAPVGGAVGVCPLPGLPLQVAPGRQPGGPGAAARLADRPRADDGSGARGGASTGLAARRLDDDTSAAARTWRISSS
jgi:hypothetical protein